MNVQDNISRSNALQREYQSKILQSSQEVDADGNYTREGLSLLSDAAKIQLQLEQLTTGETAAMHHREATNLLSIVKKRMEETGLIEAEAVAAPSQPVATINQPLNDAPAVNSAPARPAPSHNTPSQPAKSAVSKDELPEGFTIDKYILSPRNLTLADIKSQPLLVKEISEAIHGSDIQQLFPAATKEWGDPLRSNFLFYGPPGTGKSFLCSAISGELAKAYSNGNSAFFLVEGHEIASKYVGTTGHILKAIFEAAEAYDLAVICVDEIEALCPTRDGDTHSNTNYTQNFLELINGVRGQTKALVIACTNVPWKVDSALLSRLNRRVFIDYPTVGDIATFFSDKKEYCDYFGSTPEESHRLIAVAAQLCASKRYSYRSLNALCVKLRSKVEEKTRTAYPEGSTELPHMLSLDEFELRAIIDELQTDYNPIQYQSYAKYDKVETT